MEEINILVMGETGVGKSTWINAIANYVTFSSLQEAMVEPSVYLLPVKLTVHDSNFKKHLVRLGEDENEKFREGQSSTQGPRAYVFKMKNKLIRIIDTPGIGDTGGPDADKKNMGQILQFLSAYEDLHGICILLNSTNSRITNQFKYCLSELLMQLHSAAIKNMVFCFTHSRSNFYKPGAAMEPLEVFLREYRLPIELSRGNMYCLDNEAFRFLCAHHVGIKSSDAEIKGFEGSWQISVDETQRLFDHIISLRPHKVLHTISLNAARQIILTLAKPLADTFSIIAENITLLESQKARAEHDKNLDITEAKITMEYVLEEVHLEHGRMKCRGPSCKEIICHDKCDVTDGTIETFPNAKVKKCKVFKKFKLFKVAKCQVCGCPWDIHIHVIYETRKKMVPVRVEPTQQVKSVDDSIRNIELYIEQYTFEYLTITEAFARFGAFYKKNAILPYNDAFEAYINMEIEDELRLHDGFESLKLKKLTTMLDKYKEEKQMLQGIHIADVSNIPNETEIFGLCNQMFSLKFTGQQIYRLYHVAMLGKQKHYKQNHEKAYDVQRNDLFKDLYSATKKIFSRAANEPPRNKTQMEDQRQHQRPMQLKLQNFPTGSPEQHVQFNTQNIPFPTSLQPTNSLKQPIDSLFEPQQVNQENGSHKKKLSPQKSIDSGINISSPMSNSPSPKLPKHNEFSDKKSQKSELEKRFEQLRLNDRNKSDEVEQTIIDTKSPIGPPPKIPPKPKISPHSPNVPSRSSEHGPSHVLPVTTPTPPVPTPNDNTPRDPAFPVPKPRRNIPKSPLK